MKFMQVYSGDLEGVLRSQPEDFIVDEIAKITPVGEGEHVWLKIKKTSANTDWVAGQLARISGVTKRDVGFAGLKDRHAVTTQWFSVYLPGKEAPDWGASLPPSIQLLEEVRHNKKLRRGALSGNRFALTVRDCQFDINKVDAMVEQISDLGMPNYFGEQRFGYNFNNIDKAKQWFQGNFKIKDRNKRGLYLSSARSLFFNQILSSRIEQGTWNKAIAGDVLMLEGSHSCFADDGDSTITQRVTNLDIHPTAALWGSGQLASSQLMHNIETKIANSDPVIKKGLESNKLKQERRTMRVKVGDLSCEKLDNTTLRFFFSLPAGSYATVLMRQFGLSK